MVSIVRVHLEQRPFSVPCVDMLPSKPVTPESVTQLGRDLRTLYHTQADDPYFLVSLHTYRRLRSLDAISRVCRLPSRTLRRCHLRKIYQRRKRERRRWGL